jgi:16S rRNA (cytidine1402-2'-O)-methyltransferase
MNLGDGKNISLVSDAGTPLISDPGYKLIRDIKKSGFNVSSAPGVSSPVMALTLSGIPTDKFLFVGFLPIKKSSRSDYLIEISNINASIIIFESAKRINDTLMALKEILGNRKVAICRELTKKFEEIINGNISDVLKEISSRDSLKGEIVIVVSGPDASNEKDIDIESMLMDALSTMSASEASKEVSKFTNLSRKEVYNVALKLKGKNYDDS